MGFAVGTLGRRDDLSSSAKRVEATCVPLTSALAAFGEEARKAINETNELGDLDMADVFTEVSRCIDKWLWFVEVHLQAER